MTGNETPWQKSTASTNDQGCVEVRRANDGMVEVRDTKDRTGGTLRFNELEWSAWLTGVKNGEFDHLA